MTILSIFGVVAARSNTNTLLSAMVAFMLLLSIGHSSCEAFTTTVQYNPQYSWYHTSTSTTALNVHNNNNRKEFLRTITSTIAMATIFGQSPVQQAQASTTTTSLDYVPTIELAEKIKELDFSLPSYEDIKSYKASTENVKSLSIEEKPFDPTSISLRTSSSTTTTTSSAPESTTTSTEPNPVLGSLLPSLSKKGYKEKKSYDGYAF